MVALSLREPGNAIPDPAPRQPLAWVLHDGKAGMASQSLGLAEATGLPYVEKILAIRPPWTWLPPQLWLAPLAAAKLAPPWPDLVIACGRNAALPALAIRRASRGACLAVQIQDPRVGRDEFDLMLVPAHDRLRGKRVAVTLGATHRVTVEKLAAERSRFPQFETLPRPIVGVLIGGSNRAYRLPLAQLGVIADQIAATVAAQGGSVLATASRRTGAQGIALLRERFAGLPGRVWDNTGDNPYYAYLSIADALLVTADSISMISEAAATGKPVHVIELDGGDAKFTRFHAAMREAGITRPFAGQLESWTYTPLDDTARAGDAVRTLVLDHLARRATG